MESSNFEQDYCKRAKRGHCKNGRYCEQRHPQDIDQTSASLTVDDRHGPARRTSDGSFSILGAAKMAFAAQVTAPQHMMNPERMALLMEAQDWHASSRGAERRSVAPGYTCTSYRLDQDGEKRTVSLMRSIGHLTEQQNNPTQPNVYWPATSPRPEEAQYAVLSGDLVGDSIRRGSAVEAELKLKSTKPREAARIGARSPPRTPPPRASPAQLDLTPPPSPRSIEMIMAPATPRDRNEKSQNGASGGPHPSFIQVANPYIFEQKVQCCLTALGSSEAKEDNVRLQGVLWIDSVRKALQLPIRTFNTAVVYYHKFRLVHADSEYMFLDAAAAALFTACKIEDTLKKSREILCAAYNLKASISEQVSPDDQIFEQQSKTILGLERLMLESAGFDFRNRHPQRYVVKLIRMHKLDQATIGKTAYNMCIDIYRTFAPLKQTAPTLAFACVELAARISGNLDVPRILEASGQGYKNWSTSREEVLETILDLLDLYTHQAKATIVGLEHPMDGFINTRITLNKESNPAAQHARYTEWTSAAKQHNGSSNSNSASNGGSKPSPDDTPSSSDARTSPHSSSPPAMGPTSATGARSRVGERSKDGMVRFMLHAQKARDEKAAVAKFFAADEYEDYEVEIEVPVEQQEQQQTRVR